MRLFNVGTNNIKKGCVECYGKRTRARNQMITIIITFRNESDEKKIPLGLNKTYPQKNT